MRRIKRIVIVAFVLCIIMPTPLGDAVPEVPKAAWRLRLVALPTNLMPGTSGTTKAGPVYGLTATNLGGAPAVGPVTLSVTFPTGITPIFDAEAPEGRDWDASSPDPVCSKTPGQTVTCTAAGPVNPARPVLVGIPVEVSPSLALGEVLDVKASVSSPETTTVTTTVSTRIATSPPPFGFLGGSQGLSALFTKVDGSPSLASGSHPDQLTVNLGFPSEQPVVDGPTTGAGHPRDIVTDLPRGVVVNPSATVKCTEVQLLSGIGSDSNCPPASQVGMVTVTTDTAGFRPELSAVYNMVPPPGYPAMLAFDAANVGIVVHVAGGVRSESDFGLYAESPDTLARDTSPLEDFQIELWGNPTSASHDQVRGVCRSTPSLAPCAVERQDTPLLTMPSACSDSLTFAARVRSWEEASAGIKVLGHETTAQATDLTGNPVGVGSCSLLQFNPSLTLRPDSSAAESPSGVEIKLEVPQSEGPELATSNLKDARVTFPPGLVANAAAAGGQKACSPAQIGMLTGVGESPVHLSDDRPNCPDASKLGTLEVKTPVLDHPLPGAVYLAQPYQNPFGTLLASYLVIDSPQDGLVAKVASKIEADSKTGQLTASIEESPQLPFSEVKINLFSGPRAALRTPTTCGVHTTEIELVPWSGGKAVDKEDSFSVTGGPNGTPCTFDEAGMPNDPAFGAGTATPIAGSYSPFLTHLSRDDGEQQLREVSANLPPGLTGKLAGVVTCSDAAITAAAAKSGSAELASPSCPAASLIGQVKVGAGAGSMPYYTTGRVYLAGPYKNAPISGVVITPAVAGPFDLGNVVVRAPTYVDPKTAQLSLNSDRFPHILEGIPLEVRDARVSLDRTEFTRNPTNCEPMAITARATSLIGATASLFERFQVGGCRGLDYAPKLFIRLTGGTKRGAHPQLRAVLIANPDQEANTARASVALPRSEFLENAHIQTVCTRVQFAASQCPPGSIYGHARAITPLLDEPVEGPVYLRSSSNELPDMVAALQGPPDKPIKLELQGRIDSVNGGIRSTFDFVPDQPVSKFILNMQGGRKGLIINSRDICAHTYRAAAKFRGQNGKVHNFRPKLSANCGKGKRQNRP